MLNLSSLFIIRMYLYLNRKIDNLKKYISNKYTSFEIISDIGSGINYSKPGLLKLIDKINKKEVDLIIVLSKDRLLRFGFELIEYFASINNVKIEVLDKQQEEQQELVEDLVQIITVYACKLQGRRKKNTATLLKEVNKVLE